MKATLQERLNNYMQTYCLSGEETARRIGISGQQVSTVRLHNKYSQPTAKKICDLLGLEFTDYFEYSICEVCGGKYIRAKSDQATCGKHECRETHRIAMVLAYDADIRTGKREVQKHYKVRKSTRKRVTVEREATKQSINEFMGGKQYGDRQREYLLGLQKEQRMVIR